MCNCSLIDLLLAGNRFLQFSLTVMMRTILKKAGVLDKYSDKVSFEKMTGIFLPFFEGLFDQKCKVIHRKSSK